FRGARGRGHGAGTRRGRLRVRTRSAAAGRATGAVALRSRFRCRRRGTRGAHRIRAAAAGETEIDSTRGGLPPERHPRAASLRPALPRASAGRARPDRPADGKLETDGRAGVIDGGGRGLHFDVDTRDAVAGATLRRTAASRAAAWCERVGATPRLEPGAIVRDHTGFDRVAAARGGRAGAAGQLATRAAARHAELVRGECAGRAAGKRARGLVKTWRDTPQ